MRMNLTKDGIFSSLLSMVLLASVGLNFFQAREIKRFLHPPASADVLQVGETVLPLEAKDLRGNTRTLRYGDSREPTVLYVFSPTCYWCARNLQSISTVVQSAGKRYRFVGLSLSEDSLPAYLKQHDLRMVAYYVDPASTSRIQYKLWSTPTTLVISPRGEVIKAWVGAYIGENKTEVERFFSVRLSNLPTS
jgi:peroxiredoxin